MQKTIREKVYAHVICCGSSSSETAENGVIVHELGLFESQRKNPFMGFMGIAIKIIVMAT